MVGQEWVNVVAEQIVALESKAPDEQVAVTLAALYALRREWGADGLATAESMPDEPAPQSQIDILLHKLTVDFMPYLKTKAEYAATPTDSNRTAMLDDLDDVLKDIKRILSILWQGASTDEERAALKELYRYYAEKIKPPAQIGMDFIAGIEDELSDAEKYLNWYHQTKNKKYLEISKQEMAHAETLFAEAREQGVPDAELQPLVRLHNVLPAKF